jgi:hypothetical protein
MVPSASAYFQWIEQSVDDWFADVIHGYIISLSSG